MSGYVRDFDIKTRVPSSVVSTREGAEGNSRHSDKHQGNMHHCMPPSKTWVAQFKNCDLSTCDATSHGRIKTLTTREIIDESNRLILE
jgi:hypothetical protein